MVCYGQRENFLPLNFVWQLYACHAAVVILMKSERGSQLNSPCCVRRFFSPFPARTLSTVSGLVLTPSTYSTVFNLPCLFRRLGLVLHGFRLDTGSVRHPDLEQHEMLFGRLCELCFGQLGHSSKIYMCWKQGSGPCRWMGARFDVRVRGIQPRTRCVGISQEVSLRLSWSKHCGKPLR
jgi:hypothetical protein